MAGDNVVLTGFMGVGKSAVARRLGVLMGRPVVDTDDLVERLAGRTPGQLIEQGGEGAFRRWERRAVAMAASTRRAVIATGGGSVLDPVSRKRLGRSGVVVLLRARVDEILDRTGAGTHAALSRPLLEGVDRAAARERVEELLAQREPAYASAELSVDTGGRSPDDVAAEIVRLIGHATSVSTAGKDGCPGPEFTPADPGYPVTCGWGILDSPDALGSVLAGGGRRGMLVSDPLVGAMYGGRVTTAAREAGYELVPFTVPSGEPAKRLRVVERISGALLSAGIGRDGFVVALGGGAVGDTAGLAAATYMRGIRCVQMPTTLLAQVDSALGGKTAVNLPGHKNAVGAFHQPAGIVADLSVLRTLPPVEIACGLGEVLKMGAVTDRALWDQARDVSGEMILSGIPSSPAGMTQLAGIVGSCLKHKTRIVVDDERELGPREVLNFGHTLGHALEAASRGRLRHGQAVVAGMDFAAYLGEVLGVTAAGTRRDLRLGLTSAGLWRRPSRADPDRLLELMLADKKVRSQKLRFVMLEHLGRALPRAVPVDTGHVRSLLLQWTGQHPEDDRRRCNDRT